MCGSSRILSLMCSYMCVGMRACVCDGAGYNNLYCKPNQTSCPPLASASDSSVRMVDGISLAQSAAGPNALEVSDAIEHHGTFSHFTGLKSVDTILETESNNYKNPFMFMNTNRRSAVRARSQKDYRDDEARQQSVLRSQTEEERWAATKIGSWVRSSASLSEADTNEGLEELLAKEYTIFLSLGVLKEKVEEYTSRLSDLCPNGFPPIQDWADSESDAEIGMQLRAVAILLVNGVKPKVFQVQQTRYDTHSNQGPRLNTLMSDLKTGVFTFVKAGKLCGFWDDVLVSTFTDFGRRLEENSRKGTDHGDEPCTHIPARVRICVFVSMFMPIVYVFGHAATDSGGHTNRMGRIQHSFRQKSEETGVWMGCREKVLSVARHHSLPRTGIRPKQKREGRLETVHRPGNLERLSTQRVSAAGAAKIGNVPTRVEASG